MGVPAGYNVGLGLLRIWLAFAVVAVHCYSPECSFPGGQPWYMELFCTGPGHWAVPAFMIMAFLFAGRRFETPDGKWLGQRLWRLYWPLVFWAVVIILLNRNLSGGALPDAQWRWHDSATWRAFGIHLVGGSWIENEQQTWFIGTLVWLTPVLWLFAKIVPRRWHPLLWASLFMVAIALQYTGLNHAVFGPLVKWEFGIGCPAERFFEMMPYACIGLLAYPQWKRRAEMKPWELMLVAGLFIGSFLLFVHYPLFMPAPGFCYSGLGLVAIAVSATGAMGFLPFERLPAPVTGFVALVARYTMGVYLVHNIIGEIMYVYVFPHVGWQGRPISAVATIFVLSWVFCWLVGRIPCRWTKALVE